MSDATLYEETFNINSTIADKYDRVTRVLGATHDASTALTLDVNHELYPLTSGETVTMVLATTLNLDGTKDERGWREKKGESTLADMYDYVCYGKVYRFEEGEEGRSMWVFLEILFRKQCDQLYLGG
jgi:DNA-directed RNA polymerase I, II, and III subunit RPABC3